MDVTLICLVTIVTCSGVSSASQAELILDYDLSEPKVIEWGSDEDSGSDNSKSANECLVKMMRTTTEHYMKGESFASREKETLENETKNRIKDEIYSKLLLQTFRHHKKAHQQLRDFSKSPGGVTRSLLRQWLHHITGEGAVKGILRSVGKSDGSNNHQKPLDVSKGQSSSRNDDDSSENKKETLMTTLSSQPLSLLSGSPSLKTLKRPRRSDKGMMYLPIGGTKQVQCPSAADAAGVSLTQMAFLSICLTVFSIVVNVNNNINNNNNNNNINTDNNLANNNAQLSLNVNNAAQVNVMLPPPIGRKKRSSLRKIWREETKGKVSFSGELKRLLKETSLSRGSGEGRNRGKIFTRNKAAAGKHFSKDALRKGSVTSPMKFWNDISKPSRVISSLETSNNNSLLAFIIVPSVVPYIMNPSFNLSHLTARLNNTSKGTRIPWKILKMTTPKIVYKPSAAHYQEENFIPINVGNEDSKRINQNKNMTSQPSDGGPKSENNDLPARIIKSMNIWLRDTPPINLPCLGLRLCQLAQDKTTADSLMTQLASYVVYRREGDFPGKRGHSFEQFASAIQGHHQRCDLVFPQCSTSVL